MATPPTPPSGQRLLDAALELFGRQGIRATPVDQLITHAHTTPPMLYRYYGDKDGVIVAATDRWDADFRAHLTDTLDQHHTPRAKLLAVFDFLERWLTDHQWRGWLVADAAMEFADHTTHDVHQVVARHRQAMRALLGELAAAAGARDPNALAVQVQVLLDGAMIGAILDRGPGPIRAARAQAEVLLAAAGVPEP